jgi:mevalonate pyrophosphate decarboxylase
VILRSTAAAAWCSLLWALAALNTLRWSLAAQHCSTFHRQGSGSASRDGGCLAILWQSKDSFNYANKQFSY